MKAFLSAFRLIAALGVTLTFLMACSSTDSGGSVSGGVYYEAGFYDTWYYGGDYDDVDIIVTPPDRPAAPPKPAHPIAPTPAPRPTPTPMPSIPSMPRASFRR